MHFQNLGTKINTTEKLHIYPYKDVMIAYQKNRKQKKTIKPRLSYLQMCFYFGTNFEFYSYNYFGTEGVYK